MTCINRHLLLGSKMIQSTINMLINVYGHCVSVRHQTGCLLISVVTVNQDTELSSLLDDDIKSLRNTMIC